MTDPDQRHDVVIIGGGPAGLAVARRLVERGVGDVVVLDRERELGGIPRHCGHTGFGIRDFGRLMTGPSYARRAVAAAKGATLRSGVTVFALNPGGTIDITTADGPERIHARRIVIATGVCETPRAPRLISGTRPIGVTTTGALQQMVYLNGQRPFESAVIVGTELVSFSALLTMRAAGIRAAAMIEDNADITARHPLGLAARTFLGVPIHTNTRLVAIEGGTRVEAVHIENGGRKRRIACDGVIFTGRFRPENALFASSHLDCDSGTGGLLVDQFGRSSDATYYACGNLLHPVETAGHCYREGLRTGETVARDLAGQLAPGEMRTRVQADPAFTYVTPGVISLPVRKGHGFSFNLRTANHESGRIALSLDGAEVWSGRLWARPERRITVRARALRDMSPAEVRITIRKD